MAQLPSVQPSKYFSKQKPAPFTVKAERSTFIGWFLEYPAWEQSHLSRFRAEIIRLNITHIVLALHKSGSSSWNTIARTLICQKMVHVECCIISPKSASTHPCETYVSTFFGFTKSGFTTVVYKESAKWKAHSLKYSLNSFRALSCPVMLRIFLFHNPSKQNRTIHPLVRQSIHMKWWQITIMEEIRAFTWCLKKKCSNGVKLINNLSYFGQIFALIRK